MSSAAPCGRPLSQSAAALLQAQSYSRWSRQQAEVSASSMRHCPSRMLRGVARPPQGGREGRPAATSSLFAFPSVCIGTNALAVTGASNRTRRSRVNRTAPRRSEPRVRRCCFVAAGAAASRVPLRAALDRKQKWDPGSDGLATWPVLSDRPDPLLGPALLRTGYEHLSMHPAQAAWMVSGRAEVSGRCG